MSRVTSKSVITRGFVFKPKCMFGGRAEPEPAGELERSPDTLAAVGAMKGNAL